MKAKYMWIPTVLFLLAAVPLRVYQLLDWIDPETGFFTQREETLNFLLIGLGVFVLLLICMTVASKHVSDGYEMRRNIFAGVFALAAGMLMIVQSALRLLQSATGGASGNAGTPYQVSDYLTANNPMGSLVMAITGLLGGIMFLLLAVSCLRGKNIFWNLPFFALMGTVWCACRLVVAFVHYTNIASASSNMFDIIGIISLLLFLLPHAKLLVGLGGRKDVKRTLFFGMLALVFVCVFNVPAVVLSLKAQEGLDFISLLPNCIDLSLVCYLFCFLVELTVYIGRNPAPDKEKDQQPEPAEGQEELPTIRPVGHTAEKPRAQYFASLVTDDPEASRFDEPIRLDSYPRKKSEAPKQAPVVPLRPEISSEKKAAPKNEPASRTQSKPAPQPENKQTNQPAEQRKESTFNMERIDKLIQELDLEQSRDGENKRQK